MLCFSIQTTSLILFRKGWVGRMYKKRRARFIVFTANLLTVNTINRALRLIWDSRVIRVSDDLLFAYWVTAKNGPSRMRDGPFCKSYLLQAKFEAPWLRCRIIKLAKGIDCLYCKRTCFRGG